MPITAPKSLTAFPKAAERDGMVEPKVLRAGNATELVVMRVFPRRTGVEAHRGCARLEDVEDARAKNGQRAEAERKKVKGMEVWEGWEAWQGSVVFVETAIGRGVGGVRCADIAVR